MTLELSKVTQQVSQLGDLAAQRTRATARAVPVVERLLHDHAHNPLLAELVEHAIKAGWTGGVPTAEPIDLSFDPPPLPERHTIVAADGSQIYPDRHGLALYYVINIGSFVLRFGTGEAPHVDSQPDVCFEDDRLLDDDGQPISSQTINARRAVSEIARLAELAEYEAALAPTVALADGNIALRVKQSGIAEAERDRLEHTYIRQLDALRESRAAVGSLIDRPSSTSIVRLMHLADKCPPDRVTEFVKNIRGRPFDGISDTPVFAALLQPAQRSAIFKQKTQWSKPYEDTGHAIHFFYLNAGTALQAKIVRVEIPEWIAADIDRVGLLHAALLDQCRITAVAYPYALTRADELAVITTIEKANFDQLIAVELMKRGLDARPSDKAATKAFARYGKHH